MRVIKFRAWSEALNEMDYNPMNTISFDGKQVFFGVGEITGFFDSIMQYTGLKDKNGREIYEGDILRLKIDDYAGLEKPDIFLINSDEVYYADVCYLQQIDDHIKQSETDDCIEVIGNIYENPELLEEPS